MTRQIWKNHPKFNSLLVASVSPGKHRVTIRPATSYSTVESITIQAGTNLAPQVVFLSPSGKEGMVTVTQGPSRTNGVWHFPGSETPGPGGKFERLPGSKPQSFAIAVGENRFDQTEFYMGWGTSSAELEGMEEAQGENALQGSKQVRQVLERFSQLHKGMNISQVFQIVNDIPVSPATIDSALFSGGRASIKTAERVLFLDRDGLESW